MRLANVAGDGLQVMSRTDYERKLLQCKSLMIPNYAFTFPCFHAT